ncbi:MAG: hypothetical protein K8S87_08830 [Planctomycetes bacterium]|nr:hypothetical protein [Planctomycetota bacterium]
MKIPSPKSRISFGIFQIIFGLFQFGMVLLAYVNRNTFDGTSYIMMYAGFTLLCSGTFTLMTIKKYKDRYFPDRRFSTPVSPDGSPLKDNSAKLQKEVLKDASRFTEKDYENMKLGLLFIVIYYLGIVAFYFNLPDFETWVFAIITIFMIALSLFLYFYSKYMLRKNRIKNRQKLDNKHRYKSVDRNEKKP